MTSICMFPYTFQLRLCSPGLIAVYNFSSTVLDPLVPHFAMAHNKLTSWLDEGDVSAKKPRVGEQGEAVSGQGSSTQKPGQVLALQTTSESNSQQLATLEGSKRSDVKRIAIGTRKAYENHYEFNYIAEKYEGEDVYVCSKGSEWARKNEMLLLKREGNYWIAWDGVRAVGGGFCYRQPVFRTQTHAIQAGTHTWETNQNATDAIDRITAHWFGSLVCQTREM